MKEEFVFYFGVDSMYSHWFKCSFVMSGQHFCCVEQYLMLQKALTFSDSEIAEKIMKSSDPARHRYLGRQVAGFDKDLWQQKCRQFSVEGNFEKFKQNAILKENLADTTGKSFAEASPYDRIWGIGLSLQNPKIYDRTQWRGRNWAGETLEMARTLLQENPS